MTLASASFSRPRSDHFVTRQGGQTVSSIDIGISAALNALHIQQHACFTDDDPSHSEWVCQCDGSGAYFCGFDIGSPPRLGWACAGVPPVAHAAFHSFVGVAEDPHARERIDQVPARTAPPTGILGSSQPSATARESFSACLSRVQRLQPAAFSSPPNAYCARYTTDIYPTGIYRQGGLDRRATQQIGRKASSLWRGLA
jgi:hypothetical protein